MSKTSRIVLVVGGGLLGVMGLFVLIFGLDILGIQASRVTEPMRQNVQRKVFENTQSYVMGKTQALSKYYREYQTADAVSRTALEAVIRVEFADFPKKQIREPALQNFLVSIRGY